MQFIARHLPNGSSRIVEEPIEAADAAELERALTLRGSVVLEVRARTASAITSTRRFDVAWWCKELEVLLRAGMTVVEAIETMNVSSAGARNSANGALLGSLYQGASLSRAMQASGAFPDVLCAGVRASERTGALADALRDYLRYDEMLRRLGRQAFSAAMYPAVVIALGALIALFLLLFVMPRFSRMYASFQGELSLATKLVMSVSEVMSSHLWLVATLAAIGVAAAGVAATRGQLHLLAGRALEAIPWLQERVNDFRLAKLYQSLALLFRGGYTFDEALTVCQGLALGARMSSALEVARASVVAGKSAAAALNSAGLSDATTQRLLTVGERTGDFAGVLQTIAERHAQLFSTFIERATRLVEPLLLLAVAVFVGGLVVMMYLPIFDLAGGLGSNP